VQLKWTDLADIDLDKIEAHIAKENSPLIAIDVVMSIVDSVDLILPDHPRAGRQGRLKHTRELVIDGVPFIVIYRENMSTNTVEILRVLHDA
jgi:plasmid stabilization system protein ParE